MKKQDRFLKQVSDGKIIFSDAFPYIGKIYYIPKPMIAVQTEDESKQGDSRQKKNLKIEIYPSKYAHRFCEWNFSGRTYGGYEISGTL